MPFQKISRRFTIELQRRVAVLINQMPSKKRKVHQVISQREFVSGKRLRISACNIGEYMMGFQKFSNDTGTSRCVEGLYLRSNDNGTGYWIFKLDTK